MEKIIIITGSSGTGKTTIVNMLAKDKVLSSYIKRVPMIATREKKPEEIDGEEYTFVDYKTYFNDLSQNKLVFGFSNYRPVAYGLRKEEIKKCKESKKVPFLGAAFLPNEELYKNFNKEDVIVIRLLPESRKDLKNHLLKRKEKSLFSDEKMTQLLNEFKDEVYWVKNDEHLVVNLENNLEETVKTIKNIIISQLQNQKNSYNSTNHVEDEFKFE